MTAAADPNTDPITTEDVLEAVRGLAPAIAARAPEVEAARRLPSDLLDQLVGIGAFRMLLPTSHGGLGADLTSALRVNEALARADASVSWTVMIGGGAWCDLTRLPRASFDSLFADDGAIVAGAIAPSGSIGAVPGGYQVTGRWGFISGCEHATWLFGNCIDRQATTDPPLRIAVFSPDEVRIEDTWKVSGLAGTGSHHVSVSEVVVSPERTCAPLADEPCIDEPIARIFPPAFVALSVAGVALGIGQGAYDDIVTIAGGKMPLFADTALAATPSFQLDLARADTELRAARVLVHEMAELVWTSATQGTPPTLEQRARVRSTAVWASDVSSRVVEMAYRAGGGGALYLDNPLQRRLRDVHALTQHFIVRRDTLTTAGAILAGQEPDLVIF